MKPIRPDEVVNEKKNFIPSYVIEAFNRMIAKNWNGMYSEFKKDDVIGEIILRCEILFDAGVSRAEILSNRYLDVEDIYRAEGWIVYYDRPAYNESYPATFRFSKG